MARALLEGATMLNNTLLARDTTAVSRDHEEIPVTLRVQSQIVCHL